MHVFRLPCAFCRRTVFSMAVTRNRKFAFGNNKPKLIINKTQGPVVQSRFGFNPELEFNPLF